MSKGVLHFQYLYLIQALREMSAIYVQWPGPAQRDIISTNYEDRYGYPGAVGAIDCCHIKVIAPHIQARRYINRHHHHSVVIQAVCDHQLLYRDVYIGEPGSVGDIRTFKRSPLSNNLFNRGGFLSEGEHLLGDGAHPLSEQIMIPFVDDGQLSNRQKAHNFQLSGARASVERSFALLRQKWRKLKSLANCNMEYAIDHILASIVLHNFVIIHGKLPDLPGDDINNLLRRARGPGAGKREMIAEMLYPIDD